MDEEKFVKVGKILLKLLVIVVIAFVIYVLLRGSGICHTEKENNIQTTKEIQAAETDTIDKSAESDSVAIDTTDEQQSEQKNVSSPNRKALDRVLHRDRQIQTSRETLLKHESLELQKTDSTASSRRHPKLDTLRKDNLYEILKKHRDKPAR